jgi:nitrite reductase (NADH) small subunit/3-phenylpropionate/trans-cinnamate dioxygenase ferredoxin subunit
MRDFLDRINGLKRIGVRPMEEFVTVARSGDVPQGTGATFTVEDRLIALFHTTDGYRAIDDLCPHMGASLGSGHLEGTTVSCPWHAWRFDVCSGNWVDNPKLHVAAHEVRVEGDEIQVRLISEGEPEHKLQ